MEAIVAVYSDWGIGAEGTQPIVIPEDRRRFAQLTKGATVIVGRRTLGDFPGGKPLKDRENLVITRHADEIEGATVVRTAKEAIEKTRGCDRVFVIGGASVYALLADCCSTAYVNKVAEDGGAQLFFPNLDQRENWTLQSASEPISDEGHTLTFCVYRNERVKPLDAK